MFSIQKFFSKDAHFCELLEQSAAEARASAQLLIDTRSTSFDWLAAKTAALQNAFAKISSQPS
jgi:hypothetical protein